ncbi:MAG: DUF1569 domain-containing protein [Planctomycetes bacterium]|nr:DUF1569 domain-containing protein [Planctomycetota bacterium]
MTINTKQVTDRRELNFQTMEDLWADVERLGPEARATGNWTPAQIVWHVSELLTISLDGAEFLAPLPFRVIGRMLKGRMMSKTFPPGIKLKGRFLPLLPDSNLTWDEAVARLRGSVERLRAGERMTQRSPILGAMTHEEWERVHCRHAEMHFSFIQPA